MGVIRVTKYRHPDRSYGKVWVAYCKEHKSVLKWVRPDGTVTGGFPSVHAARHHALLHYVEEH